MSNKKENAPVENKEVAAPAPLVTAKFDPSKLKVVKHVTLPIMKMEQDVPKFIKAVSPIKKGKVLLGKDGKPETDSNGNPKEPVDLLDVIDLITGEPAQIVVGKVLSQTLKEDYENDSYVGRMFQITKLAAKGSGANKYHPYSILEVAE